MRQKLDEMLQQLLNQPVNFVEAESLNQPVNFVEAEPCGNADRDHRACKNSLYNNAYAGSSLSERHEYHKDNLGSGIFRTQQVWTFDAVLLLLVLPQQLAAGRLLLLAFLLQLVLERKRGTERMQETKARTPMPLVGIPDTASHDSN